MENMLNNKPINVEFTGTPEAGKTTQFKIVSEQLRSEGFKVFSIKESTEFLPSCFAKGSADAHRWMDLSTAQSLLCANASDADIIISDRGFIDRMIWEEFFYLDGQISEVEYEAHNLHFNQFLTKPDILFVFSIPPNLSIKRRGGEGRVTTESFLKHYNSHLDLYLDSYTGWFRRVDASQTIDEVSRMLMDTIHSILP